MSKIEKKGGKTMSKIRKRKFSSPVSDPQLAAQSQRVLAAGRIALGSDVVDSEQAIDLARAIAGRLAGMPSEVRLAERRSLVSLIDDLAQLSARLTAEKTRVEQRLLLRANHKVADQAYRPGETR